MTQEEKQLLLKDLCARIPNHVKVELHGEICTCLGYFDDFVMLTSNTPLGQQTNVANVKPYLRPMSSMTEEEKIELCTIAYAPDEMKTIEEKLYVIKINAKNAADFYNEHHFDYRGLIPMGLALEAPEDMYNTKTE